MIPLRDNIPSHTTPYVTYLLLAANGAVFVWEVLLGLYGRTPAFGEFLYTYGAIPAHITAVLTRPAEWFPFPMGTLLSSMFLHGGFLHLAGNMLFLHIFGDNVEEELGHPGFLLFYLLTGLTGALVHIVLAPGSRIPMVGASGAISGVMGAYILLYPRARVLTMVWILLITVIEIPAYWFLGIWFFFQFMGGLNSLTGPDLGGVAFWAHVGGFAAGWLLIRMRLRRRRRRYHWWGG